ncbi:uncharacterized protein LOC134546340 [Bacillus rossius redtenbacheri]|uniref:uncharacterized protein LOC134546340 n=1 Tax=Bacillus rossius redtenbacheri TaxID=93214 RepID=UPI002FDE414E
MKKRGRNMGAGEVDRLCADYEDDEAVLTIDIALITGKDTEEIPGSACRICGRQCDALVPVCACSDAPVHRGCLEARLTALCTDRCEACDHEYCVEWRRLEGLPYSAWLWLTTQASWLQLVLAASMASLVACEASALCSFAAHSRRVVRHHQGGPGLRAHWRHFARELELPQWFLSLSALLLCRQALLLLSLAADAAASFLRWRRRRSAARVLDGAP